MSKTDVPERLVNVPERLVKTYKDISPHEIPDDRAYIDIVDKIAPYTMALNDGLDTTYALFQAVKYVCENDISGDMVECGVWRGGSMMLIAYTLQYFGDTTPEPYLYDTFAGITEPSDIHIDLHNLAY